MTWQTPALKEKKKKNPARYTHARIDQVYSAFILCSLLPRGLCTGLGPLDSLPPQIGTSISFHSWQETVWGRRSSCSAQYEPGNAPCLARSTSGVLLPVIYISCPRSRPGNTSGPRERLPLRSSEETTASAQGRTWPVRQAGPNVPKSDQNSQTESKPRFWSMKGLCKANIFRCHANRGRS